MLPEFQRAVPYGDVNCEYAKVVGMQVLEVSKHCITMELLLRFALTGILSKSICGCGTCMHAASFWVDPQPYTSQCCDDDAGNAMSAGTNTVSVAKRCAGCKSKLQEEGVSHQK